VLPSLSGIQETACLPAIRVRNEAPHSIPPQIASGIILFVRQTIGYDLAMIEHNNAIRKIGDHLHVVFDPEHAHAHLMPDAQQKAGEVLPLFTH
jgi:hypothetical protein